MFVIMNSTAVIAKIKRTLQKLFCDIPSNVKTDYEEIVLLQVRVGTTLLIYLRLLFNELVPTKFGSEGFLSKIYTNILIYWYLNLSLSLNKFYLIHWILISLEMVISHVHVFNSVRIGTQDLLWLDVRIFFFFVWSFQKTKILIIVLQKNIWLLIRLFFKLSCTQEIHPYPHSRYIPENVCFCWVQLRFVTCSRSHFALLT